MSHTLSAIALALGLAAAAVPAAATPASAVSSFDSTDYALLGNELVLLPDGTFADGPLAGEDFGFSVFFNDTFTAIEDSFVEVFGVGPFGSDFSLDVEIAGNTNTSLSLIATDFSDGSFPQGLSVMIGGFNFGAPVLEEFAAAFASNTDIDFSEGLSTKVAPVPLPAAAWMLLAGVGGLIAVGRRKA